MKHLLHSHSPFRIFFISGGLTLAALAGVLYGMGPAAALVALVLIAIEITFSFENAIINARVLTKMSPLWQQMFMTVGIAIAIFGMRVVFPVLVVMITSGLSWSDVVGLALNNPDQYSHELERAHPSIAAFGGMFLLMLCLHFFFDHNRDVVWIGRIERQLQEVGRWWVHAAVSAVVLAVLYALPFNPHPRETIIAGSIGIATYLFIHGLSEFFGRHHNEAKSMAKQTGMAGFMSFLYLEVLDASFSFDGVIGAFAVTKDVVLIAAGLGVGALWVRSLTLFMVRRGTLETYRYLEHGAHYTIGVLALVLLAGIFKDVPEIFAGIIGISIIGAAIWSSVQYRKHEMTG